MRENHGNGLQQRLSPLPIALHPGARSAVAQVPHWCASLCRWPGANHRHIEGVCFEALDVPQKSGKYLCAVCCKGVGKNFNEYLQCKLLVPKKWSGITGRLVNVRNYICPRCKCESRPIDGRPMTRIVVEGTELDVGHFLLSMFWQCHCHQVSTTCPHLHTRLPWGAWQLRYTWPVPAMLHGSDIFSCSIFPSLGVLSRCGQSNRPILYATHPVCSRAQRSFKIRSIYPQYSS